MSPKKNGTEFSSLRNPKYVLENPKSSRLKNLNVVVVKGVELIVAVSVPKTLRGALSQIERMLTKKSYSADLWDILSAIRGPDSRDKRLKHATTTVIRSAAFPSRPCEERSFYSEDSRKKALIRQELFKNKEDFNHFRQHCQAAFDALGLSLFEENVCSTK